MRSLIALLAASFSIVTAPHLFAQGSISGNGGGISANTNCIASAAGCSFSGPIDAQAGVYANGVAIGGAPATSGLLHWWRAGDAKTDPGCSIPATTGSPIACLPDHAAAVLGYALTASNATQTISGSRPTLVINAINGQAALSFNGTSQYLNFTDKTDPGTIFVVYNMVYPISSLTNSAASAGGGGYFAPLLSGDASNAQSGQFGYLASGSTGDIGTAKVYWGRYQAYIRAMTVDATNYINFAWSGFSQSAFGVWNIMGAANTGASIQTFKGAYQMGDPAIFPTGLTVSTLNGSGLVGAAWVSHAPAMFLNGSIAEILVYNRVLADWEKTNVVNYLQQKYGLNEPSTRLFQGFQGALETAGIPNENLFMMNSSDMINYSYRPSYLVPPLITTAGTNLHSFRNSDVLRYNGQCWMASTYGSIGNGGTGSAARNGWDIHASDDLTCRNFRFVQTVTSGTANSIVNGAHWFVDSSQVVHLILDQDVSSSDEPYETHPAVAGQLDGAWTTPVALTMSGGSAAQLDDIMQEANGTYYLFFSDQSGATATIRVATSSSLTGTFTVQSVPSLSGLGAGANGGYEAPCPIYIGPTMSNSYRSNTTYALLLDNRGAGESIAYTTTGMVGTWGPLIALNTPTAIEALCVVHNQDDFVH